VVPQRILVSAEFVCGSLEVGNGVLSCLHSVAGAAQDADSFMLSAMSAIKLQLLPRISIGNCCSDFGRMLNDYLSEGCGAASDNDFLCLQEYHDPTLRVCCSWHHACIEERKAAVQRLASSAAPATTTKIDTGADSIAKEKPNLEPGGGVLLTRDTSNCAFNNSMKWLRGPRHGNLHNDPLLTPDLAERMILNINNILVPSENDGMAELLGQTICHAKSRVRNTTKVIQAPVGDYRTIRAWSVKLIFLTLHYHQHRHAIPEAIARYRVEDSAQTRCHSAATLGNEHNVGTFDYECPRAKYVVMGLSGNGLGANVRTGMMPALLIGLMTNRIVIFVNNAKQGPDTLRRPWPLASCPRRDSQCFFWPTTPCTLTEDEIKNAHVLSDTDARGLLHRETLPKPDVLAAKVWHYRPMLNPVDRVPSRATERLCKYAMELISAVNESQHPEYVALLRKAANAIRGADDRRQGYHYAAASFKLQHALTMYAMRPNPTSLRKLNDILTEIIPSNLDPETSFGLPVRGKTWYFKLKQFKVSGTNSSSISYARQLLTSVFTKANVCRSISICRS
jgi:hypothetical protein